MEGGVEISVLLISHKPVIDFLFSMREVAVLVKVANSIKQPMITERNFVVIIRLVRFFLLERCIAKATTDICEYMRRESLVEGSLQFG